ncbi:MAG: cupin domain-containing protein [Solirubrobacterales bacterium]
MVPGLKRLGRVAVALAVVAALAAAGAGWTLAGEDAEPAAKRIPLAKANNVRGAPDRSLELSRVVIPAGVKLDRHLHEGTQIAYIDKGKLRYTVHTGSVKVRDGSPGDATAVRKIKAGETGTLKPGNWIVEQPSTQHSAANRGNKKVVVFVANLLKSDAPPATPTGQHPR